MPQKCTVNDCGLFIGLVTEPVTEKDFFYSEFKNGLFNGYLKKLNEEILSTPIPEDSKLYHPVAYRIFGEYDLAIFSLVDDLDFGLHIFKPSHGYNKDGDEFIYGTQVINGLVTCNDKSEKLEEIARKTFLSESKRYPFISITKLKVNNGLLIGNGVELLESIKQKLKSIAAINDKSIESKLEIIIIDTFCNNELTLICFSNGFSVIANFLIQIRNLQLHHIEDYGQFLEICLLKKKEIASDVIIKESHLFSETVTVFGYDYQIENIENFLEPFSEISEVNYSCSWIIKPGHTKQFLECAKALNIGFSESTSLLTNTNTIHSNHSFKEILQLPTIKRGEISRHIKQFKTMVLFPKSIVDFSNFNEHPALTEYLRGFTFKRTELQEIRDSLTECHVARPSRERVLSMYNNFNNCISDVVFFISFIELRGYLDYIRVSISQTWRRDLLSNHPKKKLYDFHIWLNNSIKYFELAYNNRFHQSNRTNELPNNSLEFNGGIQQLVSLFDATYKSTLNPLGANWSFSDFVHISGFERVQSNLNTLRMNILHFIHPELFATIVYKEGINFILDKLQFPIEELYDPNKFKINKFLQAFKIFLEDNNSIYENIIVKFEIESSDPKFEEYLKLVDSDLIFDFFADIAVCSLGYTYNEKNFFYWYLKYFDQMTDCYNADAGINMYYYNRFLIRVFFVKRYLLHKYPKKDLKPLFTHLPSSPADRIENIDSFCELLYSILEKSSITEEMNFFDACTDIIENTIKKEVQIEYQKCHSEDIDLEGQIPEDENFVLFRKEQVRTYSKKFKGRIQKSEIITDFPEITGMSDSSFIQRFLSSYLSCLYDLDKNSVPEKLSDTNSNKEPANRYPSLIFPDPNGGILIHDPAKRRKYYAYRSVFYKTLWDFSTKIKINYLKSTY